jgi:hypothetical protein
MMAMSRFNFRICYILEKRSLGNREEDRENQEAPGAPFFLFGHLCDLPRRVGPLLCGVKRSGGIINEAAGLCRIIFREEINTSRKKIPDSSTSARTCDTGIDKSLWSPLLTPLRVDN